MRFSDRLWRELSRLGGCERARWDRGRRGFVDARSSPLRFSEGDWLLTAELFSEAERPGFWEFIQARTCRSAAIFYDAIPMRFPHLTWRQSVARHPEYVKMLASFDRVWAISETSREDLEGLWRWMEVRPAARLGAITLGADFSSRPRVREGRLAPDAFGLCLGILEPRKNQEALLEVCERLLEGGVRVPVVFAGRVNPEVGKPILARIERSRRRGVPARHLGPVTDRALEGLFASARFTAVPTLAEGCGLPVLESLWSGVPCVCSDLPVLREHAEGGGILFVKPGDRSAWADAIRRLWQDESLWRELSEQARSRPLPVWAETARAIRDELDL